MVWNKNVEKIHERKHGWMNWSKNKSIFKKIIVLWFLKIILKLLGRDIYVFIYVLTGKIKTISLVQLKEIWDKNRYAFYSKK